MAPKCGVPLLSQEGPTCRLLSGAKASYPALDQASIPENCQAPPDSRSCYCFDLAAAEGTAVTLVHRCEGEALNIDRPTRPALPAGLKAGCGCFGGKVA